MGGSRATKKTAHVKAATKNTGSKSSSSLSLVPTTQLEAEHLEDVQTAKLRHPKVALTESQHIDKAMKAIWASLNMMCLCICVCYHNGMDV